jgi:NAD(P)-dependent dehydrogenase (short-subunit alcohol dehydrogenase family)
MKERINYYKNLVADYSKPGLVPNEVKKKLIEDAERFIAMKEEKLPPIDFDYTAEQIEAENKDWWPTHCEALRQGRGDLLTEEYRNELVYRCQDGPYYGLEEQKARGASKRGITALTSRKMAIDYGSIRVNSIAPGWVWTPLIENLFKSYEAPAGMVKKVSERQVMKRRGTPEDIGNAAAFLASDEASFITGTQLFVDGGLTAVLEEWSE